MSLTAAGKDLFIGGGCLYDFTMVNDVSLRQRAIKALDLLYERAQTVGGAPLLLTQGAGSTSQRKTRIFDNVDSFTFGTRGSLDGMSVAGAASWHSIRGAGENDPAVPVAERVGNRIFLEPKSVHFLPEITATFWHEMTHNYTLLSHGAWSSKGGFVQPNDPLNVAWSAFIARLKSAAPSSENDPVDGQQEFIQNGTEWACRCGSAHLA